MRALDVLVVDDDRDLASGIADMLEAEGHRAILAVSGEAAIEVARERAFDMIFLDVKLPGMTGIEAGAIELLTKPINPEELSRRLATAQGQDG